MKCHGYGHDSHYYYEIEANLRKGQFLPKTFFPYEVYVLSLSNLRHILLAISCPKASCP